MIIDADTHISPTDDENTIRAEELIEQMERSGVDRAVCWLQPPYMRIIDGSLKYLYESVKRYPDKLLGFGWVDPHLGVGEGKATVKRCLDEYGFHGVKLNGAQNSFTIDNEKMTLPIIEEIAKAGSILAFHIGADAYDNTHPFRAANIAERFPETTILMIHMGGVSSPDLSAACIDAAVKHKNMHLIGSNVRYTSVIKAIRELGASRVSFGSDTPFSVMHADVCAYQAFLSDYFTQEEQNLVMGDNILKLLKI
ncbi:MAG: amidohydrolase family protein [Treponema sp.]|nr:amidohydrolase family protein [Treponema sp.]